MDAYNSKELALCQRPAFRNQIHVTQDYSLGTREPAQKLRISIEASNGAAELRGLIGSSGRRADRAANK